MASAIAPGSGNIIIQKLLEAPTTLKSTDRPSKWRVVSRPLLTQSYEHSQTRHIVLKKYKRMFRFSLENQLQLKRVDILNTLVPIAATAQVLEYFYSEILRQVEANWSLEPPANPLVLTYGPFELSLAMVGGKIPWIMVADLVQSMLELTRLQLTPTYHVYWETLDRTVSLSVLLRILPERLLGSP
ncbi:MAG: hypothetical protein Q9191_001255 [Dirinaria sp. TL-2023a]